MKPNPIAIITVLLAAAVSSCGGKGGHDDGDADTAEMDAANEDAEADVPADDGADQADPPPDVEDSTEVADATEDGDAGMDTDAGVDGDATDAAEDPWSDDGGDIDGEAPDDPDAEADPFPDPDPDVFVDLPGDGDGSLSGVVRRDAAAPVGPATGSDGIGEVIVALFDCPAFATLGCTGGPLQVIRSGAPVDLSDPASAYDYSFTGLGSGLYAVFAALDDDGSGFAPEPWGRAPVALGDLAVHPSPEFYVPTGTAVAGADVLLDIRVSAVRGLVTLDPGLGYTGDGVGRLVVGGLDRDPDAGGAFTVLGLDVQAGVDVLDAMPDPYSMPLLATPGTIWLSAYLDLDEDGGAPDAGDLVVDPAVALVVPDMGSDLVVDVVLSAISP